MTGRYDTDPANSSWMTNYLHPSSAGLVAPPALSNTPDKVCEKHRVDGIMDYSQILG
jgi:hypothetical protein